MDNRANTWNYKNTAPKVDFGNPDEMIRANGAAEAAHTDRLKAEVEDYQQVLAELRQLYDRNNELVQKLQFTNRTTTEEIRTMIGENNQLITDKLAALEAWDHKAFEEQTRTIIGDARDQIIGSIRESSDRTGELLQQSDDQAHRDNVRVYRNVQAAMIEELAKQTTELKAQTTELMAQTTELSGKLDEFREEQAKEKEPTRTEKTSLKLIIAVVAIQILEGAGLIALMMQMMH